MVVCFHLHDGVHLSRVQRVDRRLFFSRNGSLKTQGMPPLHHGSVVRIRHHRAQRLCRVRGTNHAKQGVGLSLTINHPLRIKDFVSAMLTVCLGKHHQLNIGGIAPQIGKRLGQVVDLLIRQGQTEVCIRLDER